jgi:hypothetical protein
MAALSPGRGNDCDDQANVRTVLFGKTVWTFAGIMLKSKKLTVLTW